jgi:acyl-CoA thioesterase
MRHFPTAVLAGLALIGSLPAHAERRALVIGNDSYQGAMPLQNARSDARAVAKALEHDEFKVTLKEDLTVRAMLISTAVTAIRRESFSDDELRFPAAPKPEEVPANLLVPDMEWCRRYETRTITGAYPTQWDDSMRESLIQMWIRDDSPRPLDFCSLAAMCDAFPPRVWLRRARRVPSGTVSMTHYFHADASQIADSGTAYLLAQARAQAFRSGFFDQIGQVWNQDGVLLATTHQLTYFKG